MAYDALIDSFISYIRHEKRYSDHTIISYKTDLLQFADFLFQTYEEKSLASVNHNMARSWVVALIEANINPKSVNRKIASLKAFYKFLLRGKKVDKNPTLKIKAPKVKKSLPVFVSESGITELLDQFEYPDGFTGIRDKLVIELLYGTGIRLSELLNLKEQQIDILNGTIKVKGKGNKERIIPLNSSLIHLIKDYQSIKTNEFNNNLAWLIVSDKGSKSYPMLIYRIVKKYLNLVTTDEKKSPHVLRHTFATHLLNKGADLNAIKDLLGHSSLAATQVYTHNSMEKLKSIFEQAHPKA